MPFTRTETPLRSVSAGERHVLADTLRVRQNVALTSFAAWFGSALRAAEPGCFTCRGGRQACGLPSPAQVSAAISRRFAPAYRAE
jgi:hypothetical protein